MSGMSLLQLGIGEVSKFQGFEVSKTENSAATLRVGEWMSSRRVLKPSL